MEESLPVHVMKLDDNLAAGAVPQQHHQVLSDHAAKVRELREARRKRILAKSSERLAYITAAAADANKPPLPPLTSSCGAPASAPHIDPCCGSSDGLYCSSNGERDDHTSADGLCHAGKSLLISADNSTAESPTTEYGTKSEDLPASLSSRKSTVAMEANQESLASINTKNRITLCLQSSFLPRLACAVLCGLAFWVAGFTWGRHALGIPSTLYVPVVACLLVMDLIYILVVMSFSTMKAQQGRVAKAVMQLLVSLVFDCIIFASMSYGGFLVLPKVLSS